MRYARYIVAAVVGVAIVSLGASEAQASHYISGSEATIAVGDQPVALAVNSVTNRVYVTNEIAGTVSVIDGGTNSVLTTIPVGFQPRAVAVNESTNKVYVVNKYSINGNGTVSVIDGVTNTVTDTIALGLLPGAIAVNETTNRVYVANEANDSVTVISGNAVIPPAIPIGDAPWRIAVNETLNRIYVLNMDPTNFIRAIDGSNGSVVATATLEHFPTTFAVNPVTGKVIVSVYCGANEPTLRVLNPLSLAEESSGFLWANHLAFDQVENVWYSDSGTAYDGTTYAALGSSLGCYCQLAVNGATQRLYMPIAQTDQVRVFVGEQDHDGIPDATDNCPTTANYNQLNLDGDSLGNACDADDDNDGVLDGSDLCMGGSIFVPADANGCSDAQVDDDLDGVCNPGAVSAGPSGCTASDTCAGTAPGATVDSSGCSDAQVDGDLDGVCNAGAPGAGPSGCVGSDQCPGTASGAAVNSAGCSAAQVDSDGDGVCNAGAPSPMGCTGTDLCPGTAAAAPVDAGGCSDAQVDQDGDGVCSPGAPGTGASGCTGSDNCTGLSNPGQEDSNGNGIGDACDAESAIDTDGDGYTNLAEAGTPLCANGVNDEGSDDSFVNDGCPGVGPWEYGSACADGTDSDGDGRVNDGCPQEGAFVEGQFRIGTNHLARCGVGSSPSQSTKWPSDFVSGGVPGSTDKVNILDMTAFLATVKRLNTSPGDPYFNSRWDLVPGKGAFADWINISDMSALIAGASGYPPMNSGQKVFGSSFMCTPHPVYGD